MPDVELEGDKVLLKRSQDERRPLVQRLNRIEGQIRGVRLMIEEDRHCSEELQQLKAAIAALREVALAIAEQHVTATADVLTSRTAATDGDERNVVLHDMLRVLRDGARL